MPSFPSGYYCDPSLKRPTPGRLNCFWGRKALTWSLVLLRLRGWLILSGVCLTFTAFAPALYAVYRPEESAASQAVPNPGAVRQVSLPGTERAQKPAFAPGQLVVKYRASVTECVHCLLKTHTAFQQATTDASNSLDALNAKYKVKSAEPIFRTEAEEARLLARTSAALTQYAETRTAAIKQQFAARTKRIPRDAALPDLSRVYLLGLEPDADIEAAAAEFARDPHVQYAHPNYLVHALFVPNDPYYSSTNSWGQGYDDLWGLKKLQAASAWNVTQGQGITVAVVDTGVDYHHQDLAANMWKNPGEIPGNGIDDDHNGFIDDVRGWSFVSNTNDPLDDFGHGTHVAGTIAAVGNNGLGIIGVAPKAKIMPVKGLDSQGGGYTDWLANAIHYAADNGADVLNNSWGCNYCPSVPLFEEAVRYAHGLGAVVVFAAGNESQDSVETRSPQNQPETIVVSAFDQNDQKTYFSSYGLKVDVAAPGGGSNVPPPDSSPVRNILSLKSSVCNPNMCPPELIVGGNYLRQAGTSMATPHVAGLAALVLAHQPTFTNEDVRHALRLSADDVGAVGRDPEAGFGRVNAQRALQTDRQVFLQSQGYRIVDTVSGNGDGWLNPGERVQCIVTVQNAWLPTGAAKATLISADPFVTVLTPTSISMWAMGAGETRELTFTLQVTPSAPDLHHLALELRLTGDQGFDRVETWPDIGVVAILPNPPPPSQSGWPVTFPVLNKEYPPEPASVVFVDLDGDGRQEVVVPLMSAGGDGELRVYDDQGTLLPGWPQTFEGYRPFSPIIADLDGDGKKEIFVGYVGFHQDGTPISGWPKVLENCTALPEPWRRIRVTNIVDLNHDGAPEVVGLWEMDELLQGDPCYTGERVYLWDRAGNPLPGSPMQLPVTYQYSESQAYTDALTAPAIGDLDGDGDLEIIASGITLANGLTAAHLYAWHHTGQPVDGWPVTAGAARIDNAWFTDTPSIGDLDGDGKDEVVLVLDKTNSSYSKWSGKIVVFRGDGTPVAGWPQSIASPDNDNLTDTISTLGDLDGDKRLEIVVTSTRMTPDWNWSNQTGQVYVFRADGTQMQGWPKPLPRFAVWRPGGSIGGISGGLWNQPVLADVSGDGRPDVVLPLYHEEFPNLARARALGRVFAWSANGSLVSGFPFTLPSLPSTSVTVGDLDRDGDVEMGLVERIKYLPYPTGNTDLTVHIWDLGRQLNPSANEWQMQGHDSQRTFRHTRALSVEQLTVKPKSFSPNGDGVKDTTTLTGGFNRLIASGKLKIKAADGKVVRAFVVSGQTVQKAWDGTDSTGQRVPDGTYTVILSGQVTDEPRDQAEASRPLTVDTVAPRIPQLTDAPDPFQPARDGSCKLSFTLSEPATVTLRIYSNYQNAVVRTLLYLSKKPQGPSSVLWDGKNDARVLVPPGVYAYKLSATDAAGNAAPPVSGNVTVQP